MLISLFGSAIWGSLFVLFLIRFIRLFIYLFAHFCVCCCFKCLDDFDSDSGSTTLSLIRVEHKHSPYKLNSDFDLTLATRAQSYSGTRE